MISSFKNFINEAIESANRTYTIDGINIKVKIDINSIIKLEPLYNNAVNDLNKLIMLVEQLFKKRGDKYSKADVYKECIQTIFVGKKKLEEGELENIKQKIDKKVNEYKDKLKISEELACIRLMLDIKTKIKK